MRKWNLPLTYGPKIRPVIDGTCTQTIRPCTISKDKRHPGKIIKKEVGDLVRFYVWSGTPYRSKRKTITEYMSVVEVQDFRLMEEGFLLPSGILSQWGTLYLEATAILDGIVPATGEALRDVLMSKNKIPAEGVEAQIIRWKP